MEAPSYFVGRLFDYVFKWRGIYYGRSSSTEIDIFILEMIYFYVSTRSL